MICKHCLKGVALALAVVLVAPGCGKRMVKVEGIVFLDDKPLDGATVVFQPTEGGIPATGMTGQDGVFQLSTHTTGDGALKGQYKVIITKSKGGGTEGLTEVDPTNPASMAEAMKKQMAKGGMSPPKTSTAVPEMYTGDSSPLKCKVPTEGRVEFRLRSQGGA